MAGSVLRQTGARVLTPPDKKAAGDVLRQTGARVLTPPEKKGYGSPAVGTNLNMSPENAKASVTAAKAAGTTTKKQAAEAKGDAHLPDSNVLVLDRAACDVERQAMLQVLATSPEVDPAKDEAAFFGRLLATGDPKLLKLPQVKWASKDKPRKNSPEWLTATEYKDTPQMFAHKIKALAALLKASRRSLAYTGAGLSVAAGIGMAAKGSTAQGGMGVASAGEPTLSHFVMAELNRQNLLHGWVQQNHDGLPQKAGYRQEDINEIHGSWFDPSSPVVKYSGSLRLDLLEDMQTQADTADLVLVCGTSLSGLNADQCVQNAADRSTEGKALGSVIISPQRTGEDGRCTLRLFATADEVFSALAKELGFGPRALGVQRGVRCSADRFCQDTKILVPYDRHGNLSETVQTYWDLSPGQKVMLSENNNVKGAQQPTDKAIDPAKTVGTVAKIDRTSCCITIVFNGVNKKLGLWWLDAAKRGGPQTLPVVNVKASEVKGSDSLN